MKKPGKPKPVQQWIEKNPIVKQPTTEGLDAVENNDKGKENNNKDDDWKIISGSRPTGKPRNKGKSVLIEDNAIRQDSAVGCSNGFGILGEEGGQMVDAT